jgi:hypothetical protein
MSPGKALMAVGAGHAAWGLVAYRKPLREIARAGYVDSVGDGIFQRAHADDARAAAFWFMMAGPLASLLGWFGHHASESGDVAALKVGGAAAVALGVVGVTAIPRSGFPMLPPLGVWMLREARRHAR